MPNGSVICIAGARKMTALVEELAPGETPQKRKRIVNQILSLLGDDSRKPDAAEPLQQARMRTWLTFDILPVLAPKASAPQKRKLAAKIVAMCSGIEKPEKNPERITADALLELIQRNAVCVHDQEHKCPLRLFTQVMAWELNMYFGVGDETDKAFRRCSGLAAARPLGAAHGEEER
jgi:hypothetical protein